MKIQENICEIPLQDLVDHIIKRLFQSLKFDISNRQLSLVMVFKWGFDGTTVNSYKQKSSDNNCQTQNHLLYTSLVPLVLKNKITNKIIWENSQPCSTRYNNPIRLQYIKETKDICKMEELYVEEQIKLLKNSFIETHSIQSSFLLTMIDGKVRIIRIKHVRT